jgi:hypothetical protein
VLEILKRFLGEQGGAVVPGLFSVGSWFVSGYFQIPFGADIFRAGAILGMLAGYAIGNISIPRDRAPRSSLLVAATVFAFGVGVVTMVDYYFLVGGGHIDGRCQTARAVAELGLVFVCAGFIMPIAGVSFARAGEGTSASAE